MFKLDIKDTKIITALSTRSRQSDSQLARSVGVSREVLGYRLKQLEEVGFIKNYLTVVDTARLGYFTFMVYIRLQNFTLEQERSFTNHLKKNPYVKWVTSITGNFDLFVVLMGRSRLDIDTKISELVSGFENLLAKIIVLSTLIVLKDSEQFFYETQSRSFHTPVLETLGDTFFVDTSFLRITDYFILQSLSLNARKSIVDITADLRLQNISLTAEAVAYRIKRLEKEGIIRGYKPQLDYTKTNHLWYVILFDLRTFPKKLESMLRSVFANNKKIIYADKPLGEWNLRIDLLVKNHNELRQEIIILRKLLSFYLNSYELLIVQKNHMACSFTEGILLDAQKNEHKKLYLKK